VTEETIASWLRRIDEEGERSLVQIAEPLNKFPDFVGHLVRWLKTMCPTMEKVRIAQVLARAGLQLGVTTVGRMLKKSEPEDEAEGGVLTEDEPPALARHGRVVIAQYPDHTWHVDLTVIPTGGGFWVEWLPFSRPQHWPFCWWIAVAMDQYSCQVNGFSLFTETLSSLDVRQFLERVVVRAGLWPKYLISDKGRQFVCDTFKAWCEESGIRNDSVPSVNKAALRSLRGSFAP